VNVNQRQQTVKTSLNACQTHSGAAFLYDDGIETLMAFARRAVQRPIARRARLHNATKPHLAERDGQAWHGSGRRSCRHLLSAHSSFIAGQRHRLAGATTRRPRRAAGGRRWAAPISWPSRITSTRPASSALSLFVSPVATTATQVAAAADETNKQTGGENARARSLLAS
jgi:hypothetical protein